MKMEYHIEDFMDSCVERNLSRKTCASYEQTLRLFARYLQDIQKTTDAKKVKQEMIREYITYIRERGKYKVYVDDKMKKTNHPDRRKDFGKKAR